MRDHTEMNKNDSSLSGPIFLLSTVRSGSTLLRVMLAGHSHLFCPPELSLLPYRTMREWHSSLVPAYNEGVERALMELEGIDGRAAHKLVMHWVWKDIRTIEVFRTLQNLATPRTLLDKSPANATSVHVLLDIDRTFPNTKYIHLMRHPYAVVESMRRNRFDRLWNRSDPFKSGERYWYSINATITDFFERIDGSRYFRVRFEDLVRNPERLIRDLCVFLELPFDARVLTPYDGGRMTDGVRPGTISVGDWNFHRYRRIEPGLGERWKMIKLPHSVGDNTRKLAEYLGYELPGER